MATWRKSWRIFSKWPDKLVTNGFCKCEHFCFNFGFKGTPSVKNYLHSLLISGSIGALLESKTDLSENILKIESFSGKRSEKRVSVSWKIRPCLILSEINAS